MPPQTICTTDVTEPLPSSPSGHRLIGLAWSLPVLLAFYLGLGYWLGGLCGAHGLGLVAGWLAGVLVKGGGYGLVGDMVVGILGALLGGYLFGSLGGAVGGGLLGSIVVATLGAVILIVILRVIKRA